MFKCGACGSGICAEEKFKHQKNGNTHRYVYYHCNKFKDRHCKEGAIREENLIEQLLEIIDKIDIDEIGAREKIEREINKYRKFSYSVLGKTTEFDRGVKEADIRSYAKYILTNGTKDEKREILGCIKNQIEIKNKTVCLNTNQLTTK